MLNVTDLNTWPNGGFDFTIECNGLEIATVETVARGIELFDKDGTSLQFFPGHEYANRPVVAVIFEWLKSNVYAIRTPSEELYSREEYDDYMSEMFRDYLDEIYGSIDICGIEFHAATIFEECDPIGFRVYLSDYCAEDDYMLILDMD